MTNLKSINIMSGTYPSESSITRHRDSTVTLRMPYVKWVNNTGILSYSYKHITDIGTAQIARQVFTTTGHSEPSLSELMHLIGHEEYC